MLVILSDRPFVWDGFRTAGWDVRRWAGERDSDARTASTQSFRGDPTDPATYRWTAGAAELNAVVDLQDETRAAGAIDALRRTRPEAGVLVLTADDHVAAPDLALTRRLAWTEVLRGDLEGQLRKLETQRRLHQLRQFAAAEDIVPIVVHPEPDPDALASALAVRELLQRNADAAPILTRAEVTRPETRRMMELLHIQVTVIAPDELEYHDRLIAVDFQPSFAHCMDRPRVAVIDHHPSREIGNVEFTDVRPQYGATASILTEYLRLEDEPRIDKALATALLYGIKTDTDSLARGSTAADVEAYAFLQNHADLPLLRMLERPSYSIDTARLMGAALTNLAAEQDVAVAFVGHVPEADAHVLADIADFCLALEGMTWGVAGAAIENRIVLAIRRLGKPPGAGDLAKSMSENNGSGGGHRIMARAILSAGPEWNELRQADAPTAARRLLTLVRGHVQRLQLNPRSSLPAHPATNPSAMRE